MAQDTCPVADFSRAALHDHVINPGRQPGNVPRIGQDFPAQPRVPAIAQIIQCIHMVNIRSDEAAGECGGMRKTVIDHYVANRTARGTGRREEQWQSRHTRDDRSAGQHTAPGD